MANPPKRIVFYLQLKAADEFIRISEGGDPVNFNDCMIGLFDVQGSVKLANPNPDENEKRLFLCTDMCEKESVLDGGFKIHALRQLKFLADNQTIDMNLQNVLWLDTVSANWLFCELYLKDGYGNTPSLASCNLSCTLLVFPKDKKEVEK